MLDQLLIEMQKLKIAKELLDDVYRDIGPYNTGKVTRETLNKLQKFYKFDDSE